MRTPGTHWEHLLEGRIVRDRVPRTVGSAVFCRCGELFRSVSDLMRSCGQVGKVLYLEYRVRWRSREGWGGGRGERGERGIAKHTRYFFSVIHLLESLFFVLFVSAACSTWESERSPPIDPACSNRKSGHCRCALLPGRSDEPLAWTPPQSPLKSWQGSYSRRGKE